MSDLCSSHYGQSTHIIKTLRLLKLLQKQPIRRSQLGLVIQERLIAMISRAERRVQANKKSIRSYKYGIAIDRLSRTEASHIKSQIDRCTYAIDKSRRLIGFCRDIGDSIAFIYLDRWDIKPLALKEAAGNISGKTGARLERAILRDLYKHGYLCLLNDLSGSMRYADLTVFHGHRVFSLIEAKSGNGGNKKRAARQKASVSAVLEYLRDDSGELMGQPVIRRALAEKPRYHVGTINRMVEQLANRPETEVVREVEKGVFYFVGSDNLSITSLSRLAKSEGPLITMFSNNFKRNGVAYFPFPLMMNDPNVTLQFYAGTFTICVCVDIQKVVRLSGVNVQIELVEDDDHPLKMHFPSSDFNVQTPSIAIGSHLLNRMASEFMSPRSLIRLAAHRGDLIALENDAHSGPADSPA